MNTILNVYKPIGMTPLELVNAIRKEMPEIKDEKIGYAGRLDPLAHGVMLLMIGDATKERYKFLELQKEYTFEVLLGVETDTYDILGLIPNDFKHNRANIVNEKVNIFVNKHVGTLQLPYPPYSSKAVDGRPLFWWARNNKLSEIQIPERTVVIDSFEFTGENAITKKVLQEKVTIAITSVKGDFRQDEIMERWKRFLNETSAQSFLTATFNLRCSSGTYVRGLVHELGQMLGTGAIAIDILRTKVGEYDLDSALRLKE